MAEVFAGFLAGYVLSLLTTPLLAVGLLKLRAGSALMSRMWPREANMIAVATVLHGGLAFFLTGIGLILGLILLAFRDSGGALGSLNGPFTLFVAAMTLAMLAPVFTLLRPIRPYVLAYGILVVAVFGWLMPYLAKWSE